jgi:hypothetical protein
METCKSTSETFKDCKNYKEVETIIKEGVDPKTKDYSGKNEELYSWMKKNILSDKEIQERSQGVNFEEIYGKNPVEANVLKKLKEIDNNTYKDCNNYEEAMQILQKRRPPAYERLQRNTSPRHPLQDADEATIDRELAERGLAPADIERKRNEEIAAKKEELFKPEAAESPKEAEQSKKTSSRWTEADEAGWPGSKKTPKQEQKKEEVPKEEKQKKA